MALDKAKVGTNITRLEMKVITKMFEMTEIKMSSAQTTRRNVSRQSRINKSCNSKNHSKQPLQLPENSRKFAI